MTQPRPTKSQVDDMLRGMSATEQLRLLQQMEQEEERERTDKVKYALENTKFLPTQQKLVDALYSHDTEGRAKYDFIMFTGPNQVGKSHVWACCAGADMMGYRPWDNGPTGLPYAPKIAVLLNDYDSHAKKVFEQNFLQIFRKEDLKVDRTQTGAPRHITLKKTGGSVTIFTSDQDVERLEGGTWDRLYVDEPCPRSHYIALLRGTQRTNGQVVFTMTPLSEPWLADEIYFKAKNNGGDNPRIIALTAFPEENKKSKGGHLDDEGVEKFWASLSPEELEARKFGKFTHLLGRVYKSFEASVHVLAQLPQGLDPSSCPHGVSVDPHDRKPYAIGYYLVAPGGDVYFYDEWPHEPYEDLRSWDNSIEFYADMFLRRPIRPHFWQMDPNYGRRVSMQTGMNIAEQFQVLGFPFNTDIIDDLSAGHAKVNEYLNFNKEQPLSETNRPKVFFTSNCRNILKGFNNYIWDDHKGRTADLRGVKEKPKEKFKDFPDVIRYALMDDIHYFNPLMVQAPTVHMPTPHIPGWSQEQENYSDRLKRLGYS